MSRAYMPDLLRRVEHVYHECGGGQEEKIEEGDEDLDEFARLKKQIVTKLTNLRKNIKERDEVQNDRKKAIMLSQQIRKELTQVKEDEAKLQALFTKLSKKKPNKKNAKEFEDLQVKRKEQMDLVRAHIKEVEALDRRRFAEKVRANAGGETGLSSAERKQLFKQLPAGTGGGVAGDGLPDDPTDSNLPEIDISEGLAQVRKKDELIDQGLDALSKQVTKLGQIAQSMNDELKTQQAMLDVIEQKIDKNTENIISMNAKLKKTLDQIGGSQRFIVVIILLVVIAAIAGLCYLLLKQFFDF